MTKLAHVNLKLNADNKILKAGQDELKSEVAMLKSQLENRIEPKMEYKRHADINSFAKQRSV